MDKSLDDLLCRYWDLAFDEGQTGVSHGSEADDVFRAIKQAASMRRSVSMDDVAREVYLTRGGEYDDPNWDSLKFSTFQRLVRATEAVCARLWGIRIEGKEPR